MNFPLNYDLFECVHNLERENGHRLIFFVTEQRKKRYGNVRHFRLQGQDLKWTDHGLSLPYETWMDMLLKLKDVAGMIPNLKHPLEKAQALSFFSIGEHTHYLIQALPGEDEPDFEVRKFVSKDLYGGSMRNGIRVPLGEFPKFNERLRDVLWRMNDDTPLSCEVVPKKAQKYDTGKLELPAPTIDPHVLLKQTHQLCYQTQKEYERNRTPENLALWEHAKAVHLKSEQQFKEWKKLVAQRKQKPTG